MKFQKGQLVVKRSDPDTQMIIGNMRDGTKILIGRYDAWFGFLRGSGEVIHINDLEAKEILI